MKSLKEIYHEYMNGDMRVRARMSVKITIFFNYAVSVGKAVIGILTSSAFFFVSAIYSLILGLARQIYHRGAAASRDDVRRELKYYLRISIMYAIAALIYTGYMLRLFFLRQIDDFGLVIAIAVATVSFVELAVAIRGLIRANKRKDMLVSALKTLNFSCALVAIVMTQSVLLGVGASEEMLDIYCVSIAISGLAVGCVSFLLASLMIAKYFRERRKLLKSGVDLDSIDNETDDVDYTDDI